MYRQLRLHLKFQILLVIIQECLVTIHLTMGMQAAVVAAAGAAPGVISNCTKHSDR